MMNFERKEKAALLAQFERNQTDPMLTDTRVQWAGERCILFETETANMNVLASVTANEYAVEKLQVWCAKNHYRCSRIVNGRAML